MQNWKWEMVGAIGSAVGAAVALLAAVYALIEYRRGEAWKRHDLAAQLVAALGTDEELAFACQALDWGARTLLAVPSRWRALLACPDQDGGAMVHDTRLLHRAMRINLQWQNARDGQDEDDRRELVYRLCFDRLFAHLAEAHRLLANGRLAEADLLNLAYYLKRIERYEYPPQGVAGEAMFTEFLGHDPFGYRPVRELAARLLKGDAGEVARAACAAWRANQTDDAVLLRSAEATPPSTGEARFCTTQERGEQGCR